MAETVPDWVQYFGGSKVFCGFCGGEIASFCITEEWEPSVVSDGVHRTGAVGCVGTVPRFRRQGIGLKMVALAAEELKSRASANALSITQVCMTGMKNRLPHCALGAFRQKALS